jgi:transposase InsO family protein
VELQAIPKKILEYTAAALKDVLCQFGAPANVLTDQGEKFQGDFAKYLAAILADHRETLRNHPQSNGLVERMVQMVKRALRKYCLLYNRLHWNEFLPWIAMGYRMRRHVALGGYLPYFILFGRHPIVGSRVCNIVAEPIDLNDALKCVAIMRERALLC